MIDVILEQVDALNPAVVSVVEYDIENNIEVSLVDTCNTTFAYSKYNVVGERINGEIIFSASYGDDFDYEEYAGIDLDDD